MKVSLISVDGHVSLGIRSISAKLKVAGHSVKPVFFPYTRNEVYSEKILNGLKEIVDDSRIIGISSMAYSSKKAIQIIRCLKVLNVPIVWGGVFPTTCPEFCIEHADIVCVGEGEEAILDLVNKLEDGRDFRNTMNFFVKDKDGVITNLARPLIQDLDSLPFPDYDLMSQYTLENERFVLMEERHLPGIDRRFGGFTVFNIRGCPYSCTYCVNEAIKSLYKNQRIVRKNSIHHVIRQMKETKKNFPLIKRFRIDDDTFFIRSLEEIKLFTELYKKEIDIPFECNSDPLTIDDEKLQLLVDADLRHIGMGIQTGSKRINEEIFVRPFTRELSLNAAKIINKYYPDVEVTYDFIVLNPFENENDIIQTLNLIQELPKPFYLSMNCMAFFPGSKIYNKALKMGVIHNKNSFCQKGLWTRYGEIRNIKLSTRNKYLNLILLLIDGRVDSERYGEISNRLFSLLMNKRMIRLFNHSLQFATYIFVLCFKSIIYVVTKLLPEKPKSLIKSLFFKRMPV